jgi:hypothetical protein
MPDGDMTAAEFVAMQEANPARRSARERGRPSKYGARKTERGGRVYDSAAEASRAEELDRLLDAGAILWWMPQPRVRFLGDDKISYAPDFIVCAMHGPHAVSWFEEVKGVPTEKWKLQLKLFRRLARLPLRVIYRDSEEWVVPDLCPKIIAGTVARSQSIG